MVWLNNSHKFYLQYDIIMSNVISKNSKVKSTEKHGQQSNSI